MIYMTAIERYCLRYQTFRRKVKNLQNVVEEKPNENKRIVLETKKTKISKKYAKILSG